MPENTPKNPQFTIKLPDQPGKSVDMNTVDSRAEVALEKEQAKARSAEVIFDIDDMLEREKKSVGGMDSNTFFGKLYNTVNQWVVNLSRIKLKEKVAFFQLLSVMIGAGIPFVKALTILADQTTNPRFKTVILQMAKMVDKGSSLSASMSVYDTIFTEAQVGMVESAEASGQMNEVMRHLAEDMEKSQKIMGRIRGAMIYPSVIFGMLILVGFLMLIFVVPQIVSLFSASKVDLPWPTRLLIFMSTVAVSYWPVVILGVIGLVVAVHFIRKTESGKYFFDSFRLVIPVIGPLSKKVYISRFSRGLANLLKAGIPIVKALYINAHAIGNEVYKIRIESAADDVKRGIPLGENLSASKNLFPPMVSQMIVIGEQTAQLDLIANKIADFYDEEVDLAVGSLSKIMEPLIMVIVGVGVGFMVSAIMMPILQLSDITSAL
ncbi:type II secretion system F family protein [Candidatus Peregrinibacteria bacterium]|nr:type II secretion system F family protein [Candidatus Peregrinibacteria bacterium]